MLSRERVLLALIADAGGHAARVDVTSWAFVIRHETPSEGGSSFYEFVPHPEGPHSFCLSQEAAGLIRDGRLETVGEDDWRLTDLGAHEAERTPKKVRADVRAVLRDRGGLARRALTDHIQEKFPWYTVHRESERGTIRPVAPPAVYTAGYGGRTVDGFLNGLLKRGVARIIDVRNNPVSRKFGFYKSTLQRMCQAVELEYVHEPSLGIRSQERQELDDSASYERLFAHYDRTVLPLAKESIDRVAAIMAQRPSALVCMEAEPTRCHRSHLAPAIAERNRLPVVHLELGS